MPAPPPAPEASSLLAAAAPYHVGAWGNHYFTVNEAGHAAVRPAGPDGPTVDLFAVVERLRARGVRGAVTLRFRDLLGTRVHRLHTAFQNVIDARGYPGTYRGVYPIKVNQYRSVVEALVAAGAATGLGLECGSKAELVAALPYALDHERLLVCNGCKDAAMMTLLAGAQGAGGQTWPVLERRREFDLLRQAARRRPAPTDFGVRVRLATSGAGLWSESSGEHSKFGLSLSELLDLADALPQHPALQLRLLHVHLGSQISHLASVEQATREATRVYAALRHRGAPIDVLDLGGGLGVPYEAGNPEAQGYVDYALGAYAGAIVGTVQDVCADEGVPPPDLVTESGRALTAYHAVFVTEVLDVRRKVPEAPLPQPEGPLVGALAALAADARSAADADALRRMLDDAEHLRRRALDQFLDGHLHAAGRAAADRWYWAARARLADRVAAVSPDDAALPGGARRLRDQLADQVLCDFSLFRSLPDHWALGQRFPIMPLHRLDEAPTRPSTLIDLTCDSDGAIKDFVTPQGTRHTLPLHPLRDGEPYYLGFFLVGAYQDVLGDKHNLFGHVDEALVDLDPGDPGHFCITAVRPATTVAHQLREVHYDPARLAATWQAHAGPALQESYARAVASSTYLDPDAA